MLAISIVLLLNLLSVKGECAPESIAPASDPLLLIEDVINLYSLKISEYTEDYNWPDRFEIEGQLLVSERADFSSDIPGLEKEQLEAGEYFSNLKSKKIKISYAKDFDVFKCDDTSNPVYGVFIDKTVILPSKERLAYQDFIEVRIFDNKVAKIGAIASNRYNAFNDISCDKPLEERQVAAPPPPKPAVTEKPRTEPVCNSLIEADKAREAGQLSSAISLYQDALGCNYREAYIRQRIDELSSRQNIDLLLREADNAYSAQDYSSARRNYETLLGREYLDKLTTTEADYVRRRVQDAKTAEQSEELLASADYHFSRKSYTKARDAYRKALLLQPGNSRIADRIAACNTFLNGDYQRQALADIASAVRMIEQDRRKYDEAAIILLQYEETGLLNGQQLFYLAQILDGQPTKVKKTYGLSARDVCVKTKILVRKAIDLGFSTDAFDFFVKDHFNNRSRNCS